MPLELRPQPQPRPALEDLPGTGFSETQLGARRLAWKPPEVPSGAEFPWDKSGLQKQLGACSCSVLLLLLTGLGCRPGPCSVGMWVMLQQPRCPASRPCFDGSLQQSGGERGEGLPVASPLAQLKNGNGGNWEGSAEGQLPPGAVIPAAPLCWVTVAGVSAPFIFLVRFGGAGEAGFGNTEATCPDCMVQALL